MSEIGKDQNFLRRLSAYLKERFPPLTQGILIASYFSSNQFVALALINPGASVYLTSLFVPGLFLLLCIFLHLRVFDEHKDYLDDCKHHPHRVLSRGIVTLAELKFLGVLAITCELIIAYFRGWETFTALFFTLSFSLLMLKEFFVPAWLNRHFLIYTASHMCIMPLISLTVFSFVTERHFWDAPGWFYIYSLIGMFVTLNWEISRKIRAPQDEKEGINSYSSILGLWRASVLVILIRVMDTGLVFALGYHLKLNWFFYLGLSILFITTVIQYVRFQNSPTTGNAKRLENNSGFYIIAFDLILAVSIATSFGISWRLR